MLFCAFIYNICKLIHNKIIRTVKSNVLMQTILNRQRSIHAGTRALVVIFCPGRCSTFSILFPGSCCARTRKAVTVWCSHQHMYTCVKLHIADFESQVRNLQTTALLEWENNTDRKKSTLNKIELINSKIRNPKNTIKAVETTLCLFMV